MGLLWKILWTAALIGLTFLVYNEDFRSATKTSKAKVKFEQIQLIPSNNGLRGATLDFIIPHPDNPNAAIAAGLAGHYITWDQGKHWELMQIGIEKFSGPNVGIGETPHVLWNYDGKLVAYAPMSLFLSDSGYVWKEFPAPLTYLNRIGLDTLGRVWVDGFNHDVQRYEYYRIEANKDTAISKLISSDKENRNPFTDHFQAFLLEQSDQWKIERNRIFYRADSTQNWIYRDGNIERPLIQSLVQNTENPRELWAEEVLFLSEMNNPNAENTRLWFSDDFGKSWEQVEGSGKNELIQTVETGNCDLQLKDKHPELEQEKIEYDFSEMGRVDGLGWSREDEYYLFGEKGIQIGQLVEDCEQEIDVLWSWGIESNEGILYRISFPSNEIKDQNTKPGKEIALWPRGDSLSILIQADYGGLWRVDLSTRTSLSWRKMLHYFIHSHAIWGIWILTFFLFWLIYNQERERKDVGL